MKLSHKLIMVSAAALMSVSPLVNTTQNVNAATASSKKTTAKKTSTKKATTKKSTSKKADSSKKTTSKKTTSNTIKLIHNAYVYDKNGKRI
ncbi:cell division protein, partial [Lactobacillus helveticus]